MAIKSAFQGGVGLRAPHYPHLETRPKTRVHWFEALSENYMNTEGRPMKMLELIRKDYPVSMHGVSLSIGSPDVLNQDYLESLKRLADRVEPFMMSDHLCWTRGSSHNSHDLLPMPYTEETIQRLLPKVQQVQDFLKRPIMFENVSAYLAFEENQYTEWDFLVEFAKRSGCKILLDINNVHVNAENFGFDAKEYLDSIPAEIVGQIHLAGYSDMGDFLFDTHSNPVFPQVWQLFSETIKRLPDVPVLIEWDEDIPEFSVLENEVKKASKIWSQHHG
jgi:uncharacterized protein (UPF0276 family)